MPQPKPFAPSAERNQQAILEALQQLLDEGDRIFEFGSGTGQHACHIAALMPSITWQPSELPTQLAGIEQWIGDSGCQNILQPIEVDLSAEQDISFNPTVCYSANTLHIVSWNLVLALFTKASTMLTTGEKLIIYGPYKVNGQHISEGNARFDEQLRQSNPTSGIRDIAELDQAAIENGFCHSVVVDMPTNNKILCWTKE